MRSPPVRSGEGFMLAYFLSIFHHKPIVTLELFEWRAPVRTERVARNRRGVPTGRKTGGVQAGLVAGHKEAQAKTFEISEMC